MKISSIALLIAPRLFAIRKRTWAGLGIGALVLVALIVWAGIASMSWLWGQAPGVAESGKRAASVVLGQAEQSIPGVREKIEQIVPDVRKQIDEVVPGVREQVGAWLPGSDRKETSAREVGGTDIGPVARFPGLARDHFHRDENGTITRYLGRAEFQPVLDHYARGFAAAGYDQQIISAARDSELHRYTQGSDWVEMRVSSMPGREIQVELKSPS